MLSRLSLGIKLWLLIIPLALMSLLLAGGLAWQRYQLLADMQSTRQLVDLAGSASALVDTLQAERGQTNGYLGGQGALPDTLRAARSNTDRAMQALQQQQATLAASPLAGRAGDIAGAVQGLLGQRAAIDSRSLPAPQVFADYTRHIEALLALVGETAKATHLADITLYGVALSNLQCVKEFAGRERGFVNGVLAGGRFTQATLSQAIGLQAQQRACQQQLHGLSQAGVQALLAPHLQSARNQAVQNLRDPVS